MDGYPTLGNLYCLTMFYHLLFIYYCSNGYYALGIRTLLELQTSLKDEYLLLKECTLCMDIISKGERCDDERCDARLHYHCAQRYFRPESAHKCPVCQKPWSHTTHIGPRAADSSLKNHNTYQSQVTRSNSYNTSQLSQATTVILSDEEEEEEDDDEVSIVATRRSSKRLRH
ncbi:hypothetical protein BDF22DRAFT_663330 [Syncephalis plumigaleata]|nr:hypothetical protein BDF22DRAFT_663330 [Syncephalis plumigaleata]